MGRDNGEGAGLPDGMKTDSRENVYCCAQGGIHIFNKNADYLGIIKVPEQTGNCAFGDRTWIFFIWQPPPRSTASGLKAAQIKREEDIKWSGKIK